MTKVNIYTYLGIKNGSTQQIPALEEIKCNIKTYILFKTIMFASTHSYESPYIDQT